MMMMTSLYYIFDASVSLRTPKTPSTAPLSGCTQRKCIFPCRASCTNDDGAGRCTAHAPIVCVCVCAYLCALCHHAQRVHTPCMRKIICAHGMPKSRVECAERDQQPPVVWDVRQAHLGVSSSSLCVTPSQPDVHKSHHRRPVPASSCHPNVFAHCVCVCAPPMSMGSIKCLLIKFCNTLFGNIMLHASSGSECLCAAAPKSTQCRRIVIVGGQKDIYTHSHTHTQYTHYMRDAVNCIKVCATTHRTAKRGAGFAIMFACRACCVRAVIEQSMGN